MEVRFHAEVEYDLTAAAGWYEGQRPDLGREFLAAFDVAVETIRRLGARLPIWRKETRVVTLTRFPYGVYYRMVSNDVALVVTVRHLHRHSDAALDRPLPEE